MRATAGQRTLRASSSGHTASSVPEISSTGPLMRSTGISAAATRAVSARPARNPGVSVTGLAAMSTADTSNPANGMSAPSRVQPATGVAPIDTTPPYARPLPTQLMAARNSGYVAASSSASSPPREAPATAIASWQTSPRRASHDSAFAKYSSGMRSNVFGSPGIPK